jgi:hypothetical protein
VCKKAKSTALFVGNAATHMVNYPVLKLSDYKSLHNTRDSIHGLWEAAVSSHRESCSGRLASLLLQNLGYQTRLLHLILHATTRPAMPRAPAKRSRTAKAPYWLASARTDCVSRSSSWRCLG